MKKKKGLIITDLVVAVCLLFMLIAHGITNYIVAEEKGQLHESQVAAYLELREANPFAQHILAFSNVSMILRVIAIPSMVLALYVLLRRKITDVNDPRVVYTSVLFLSVTMMDALHDLSILMGYLS